MHIHVAILPQTPLPSRLPHNWAEFHVLLCSFLVIHSKQSSVYMSIHSLSRPSCFLHLIFPLSSSRGTQFKSHHLSEMPLNYLFSVFVIFYLYLYYIYHNTLPSIPFFFSPKLENEKNKYIIILFLYQRT